MIAFRAMPVRDIDFPYKQMSLEPIERAIRRQQMVARLTRNPLADFVFRVCDKVLSYKTVRFAQDAVEEVQAKANDASAITGYDQESDDELLVAMKYAAEIDGGFAAQTYSHALYQRQVETLTKLLATRDHDTFINFGVSYAYVDDLLASKFPNVTFIGVDRSKWTKMFNEMKLAGRPNLSFAADDILTVLRKTPTRNGIFFHAPTGTYIPKPALLDIYKAARESGYRTIAAYEPFGLSRVTGEPYQFSFSEQPSIAYYNGMIIHNYPKLVVDAGYVVANAAVVETDFPIAPDHRILELIATG